MIYLTIFILFFVSLFSLYSLSKNDFILLRKDISLIAIFNHVFFASFLAFIIGRLLFIINYSMFELFHPIVFFHIVKFNGFSWFGAYLGGMLALFLLSQDKKILKRAFDIYSLSFYLLFASSLIFYSNLSLALYLKILLLVAFIISFFLFINFHKSYVLKDSSIFYVILIIFSVGNFIIELFNKGSVLFSIFTLSQILSIVSAFIVVVFLLKNEIFSS